MTDKAKGIDLREVDAFLTQYFPYDKFTRPQVKKARELMVDFLVFHKDENKNLGDFLFMALYELSLRIHFKRELNCLFEEGCKIMQHQKENGGIKDEHLPLGKALVDCCEYFGVDLESIKANT